ncbi:MAG: tRNA threonylcarbamoyladenosine dehydratase [Proteobacteria bacterium]|nr:tRNA threonylcarbamoyladenosine dehydratase [Pseudomonadota bacterium]
MQDISNNALETYKLHRRFDRMGRLVGDEKMKKLMNSHVMVIGLGGVGSWSAESIARSGVGKITLVDFDEICVTNFNRQIHALDRSVGSQKTDVMADRLQKINPAAQVVSIAKFYNSSTAQEIFSVRPDYVIDAIDNVTAKCHLLAFCREQKIPVVTSTGSGGRLDPTAIKVADLALTTVDPLARAIRGILREKYAFPSNERQLFGIPAIYSTEPALEPRELHYDGGKGFQCVCPQGDNPYFQCENRNVIMGNASFVTGTFGLMAASVVIRGLLNEFSEAEVE